MLRVAARVCSVKQPPFAKIIVPVEVCLPMAKALVKAEVVPKDSVLSEDSVARVAFISAAEQLGS
jgi:hypothetical protein